MRLKIKQEWKKVEPLLRGIFSKIPAEAGITRYLRVALLTFVGTFLASYFCFRHSPLELAVHLSKVEFKEELPQSVQTEGELRPFCTWDIKAEVAGKLEKQVVAALQKVQKDQVVGIVEEAANRQTLEAALARFKQSAADLSASKRQLAKGSLTHDAFGEIEQRFEQSKKDLLLAKEKIQASLIRAPVAGSMWWGSKKPGDVLTLGDTVGTIEDASKLAVSARIPSHQDKKLPSQCQARVRLGEEEKTLTADVHYKSARPSTDNELDIELVFPASSLPSEWIHQKVQVKIDLPPLKRVAFIDRKAIVPEKNDSWILVLTPSGTLHWQKVTHAQMEQDRLLLKGVDRHSFRVVLPENLPLLRKAIELNLRPEIES